MTRRLSRRTLIRALAAGSVPITAGTAAGETAAASGPQHPTTGAWKRHATTGAWTQHGASGANTNATAERGPQYNQHTDWTVDLPSADSAPLVADDTVFVLDLSGDANQIHGRHAATGTERMTVSLDATVVSGVLAADSQRVYTTEVVSPRVHAFSIPDGDHVWQTDLGSDEGDGAQPALGISGGFRTEPRLHDSQLYLVARSGEPQGGGVVVLDSATGELVRVFSGRFSAFAVDADRLVGARGDPSLSEHGLVALDTATGERHWEYTTPGRPGRPTLGDDRVFAGTSENRIHAVGPGGDADWTAPLDGWAVSLSLGEDTLLAQTDESLVAFDTESGQRRWDTAAGDTRPVVANGFVYVGRERGFDAYELRSGEAAASYRNRRLDGPLSYLSVADGSLFATAPRGLVLAVEERIRLRALLDM
jgi:outer membrane protein assembly factor BamB